MKIRLTPELSYLIGFWRKRRTKEGLGVWGEEKFLEIFSQQLVTQGLTTPDKMLHEKDKIYCYHTAYRRFFQEIEEEQLERFKYMNDYAASYLAGLFDSSGGIDEKGFVYLSHLNTQDEMLLLRLGFGSKRKDERSVIERPKAFLVFIRNYVKIHQGHKVFGLLDKRGERRRRKTDSDGESPAAPAKEIGGSNGNAEPVAQAAEKTEPAEESATDSALPD